MSEAPRKIRVLVADDEKPLRHALTHLLARASDIVVVGEAADGDAAMDLAITEQPDVVLMDSDLPPRDGMVATRRLAEWVPTVKVIILALDRDDDGIFRAMQAGARRYLTKDTSMEEILRVIRDVYDG